MITLQSKKATVKITFGILILVMYIVLWRGYGDFYQLQPLKLVKPDCYAYTSDEDIKNIARHKIIENFGQQGLDEQQHLTVRHRPPDEFSAQEIIYVGGHPYGFVQDFYRIFFTTEYIHNITAEFRVDKDKHCVEFISALYPKN